MRDPGFYNISDEEYHRDPALSKGMLDKLAISAAHYKSAMETESRPTPEMNFGGTFHCALLKPKRYKKEYISMPENMDKRTKEGKEFIRGFDLTHKILSYDDNITINSMIEAVNINETAKALLSKGQSEVSYFWKHRLGFMCKCKPDHIQDDIMIDIKTTINASLNPFSRAIANYHYHFQAAWYLEGVKANGVDIKHFLIIAVEKIPPYAVATYMISPQDIYLAEEEIKPLLDLYIDCKTTDRWPAYPDRVQNISLPQWYLKKAEI